ncbi:MAG: right-handed parallel beta-helix repeat-containing protein [Gemmatimonadota bacterium]
MAVPELIFPSLLLLLALPATTPAEQPSPTALVRLTCGMVITRSVRIAPGHYALTAPAALDSACVTIRGENLSVDFSGAAMDGSAPGATPDRADGVAIRVSGGRNVRLLNARIRGYRVAILARDTRGLTIENSDLSHNWKPRLYSLIEHESLVDWLSFHHNERDEWLRYGAAIYLAGVRGGTIRGNVAEQGMNGLMLSASDSIRIEDNSFSFNSGLGIGLYRSSDNVILHNRLDYDVRGYSHGFYRRGQDSAGLLIFEQSTRNLVAWNSVTHGGDGLFLWAGQTTMDSGTGGANDNRFIGNDFSYAPTNAMEATFSQNEFVANRVTGSDHGLWGGYSHDSRVIANCFSLNRIGIAIEHGQHNQISGNRFFGDSTAIRLWGDSLEPSDWGYPRHRDTRSHDYWIDRNRFAGHRVLLRVGNTAGVTLSGNRWSGVDSIVVLEDSTTIESSDNSEASDDDASCAEVPPVAASELARLPVAIGSPRPIPASPASRRDRAGIAMTEWGPYDWRSPILWPVDSSRGVPLRLTTLGPAGRWKVIARHGVAALSVMQGRIGDTLVVTPAADSTGDWAVVLEYRGGATRSPGGAVAPAGAPYRFAYERFEPATEWEARVFHWSDSTDPRIRPEAFAALTSGAPALHFTASRLDLEWYRPTIPGIPLERWALEATAAVDLPDAMLRLRTISDDGIRVWIDGDLAIDHWDAHESAVDEVPIAPGRHRLRVRYYQADGWTELRVEIVRADNTDK